MTGFFDFIYAKKAWLAGLVAAIMNIVNLVQVAIADEAITFDEAEGIWLGITSALGTLGIMVTVFQAKNASTPS